MSEHQEQCAVVDYCRLKANTDDRYNTLFAIPNAGKRSIAAATYYRNEGLARGVPDLFLATPAGGYCGLFIEMKVAKGQSTKALATQLTPWQKEWILKLSKSGYAVAVCWSGGEAIELIDKYIEGKWSTLKTQSRLWLF